MRQTVHVETVETEDAEGRRVHVHIFQEVVVNRSLSGATERITGSKLYRLEGGGHVHPLGNGNFEIVATGVTLRRV